MKHKSLIIWSAVAVAMMVMLLSARGFFTADNSADRLLAVCDSVSSTGLLYLCFGLLLWISTTGVFDMLGYAIKKGAHYIVPGLVKMECDTFYDYKLDKQDKPSSKVYLIPVLEGVALLAISAVLIICWYRIANP